MVARHGAVATDFWWLGPVTEPLATLIPSRDLRVESSSPWMARVVDAKAALESRGYPQHAHAALQFVLTHEPIAQQPLVALDRMTKVYAAASACAAPHLARFLAEEDVAAAAEWVTRVVLTYTFNPAPATDLCDEDDARRFVHTFVLPALIPQSAARSSR